MRDVGGVAPVPRLLPSSCGRPREAGAEVSRALRVYAGLSK